MTASADLLIDAFGRVREAVYEAIEGMTPEQLAVRIDPEANSVGWLVWHLTRVQDDHIAAAAQTDQLWTAQGWADRFGLPYEPSAIGYGQTSTEVGAFRVASAELLTGYHDAVHDRTVAYVAGLQDSDFTRIVDESWDPPVTLGVRLVSVISDDLQHAGQAAFACGILRRRQASSLT